MALVALSASYGAAGSRIGPTLAERLGVPFLDRAIPLAVAERLEVSFDDAAAHDGQASGSWLERMLSGFIGVASGVPAPLPADVFSSDDFRLATEEVLLHQASTGEGVILGRACALVLRERPEVLRVRLDGPEEARLEQAMRIQGIDRETARERMRQTDRARDAYVRHFYGADPRDMSIFHLVIDSTALPWDTVSRLVVTAARARGFEAGA